MKKYSFLALALIVLFSISSCKSKTDWVLFELNGKVKTYTENFYEPIEKFGEWQAGKQRDYGNYTVKFNSYGDYEQMDFLDENNELRDRMIPKKEDGRIIEEALYDASGGLQTKTKFTYLSDTKFEFVSYNVDGEEVAYGKSFLKNDKIIRRDYKMVSNGVVDYEVRVKFEYGDNGLASGLEEITKNGDVTNFRFEYLEFDAQNNWTKRLDYSSKDSKVPEKIVVRTYEYY